MDSPGPRIASWEPDVRLTNTPAASTTIYNFGRTVAASAGRLHAVWRETATTAEVDYARSLDGGTTWLPAVRLSSTPVTLPPIIAAAGDTVIATWSAYDEATQFTVRVRRSLDGGETWQPEQTLTTTGRSALAPLQIVGERVYLVWAETEDPAGPEIYFRRSLDLGATWEAPVKISNSYNSPSWVPTISAVGDLVLVGWVDYADANEEEYLRRSTDGGITWGPITRLTADAADSWAPSIAIANDDVYLTWFDRRDAGVSDVDVENALDAALIMVGLAPQPSPPRDPSDYYLPLFEQRIKAKQQALAGAAPTWVQNGGDQQQLEALVQQFMTKYQAWVTGWELYIKRSTDGGGTWSPDARLTTASGMSARPSIVAIGDEVHVVWFDARDGSLADPSGYGGFTEIYYKASTDRGLTWSDDTRLTNATGDSSMAGLATDGDQLHVVWTDERDGNAEVYYKRATLGP